MEGGGRSVAACGENPRRQAAGAQRGAREPANIASRAPFMVVAAKSVHREGSGTRGTGAPINRQRAFSSCAGMGHAQEASTEAK